MNNEQKEILKIFPFTTASKRIKYFTNKLNPGGGKLV